MRRTDSASRWFPFRRLSLGIATVGALAVSLPPGVAAADAPSSPTVAPVVAETSTPDSSTPDIPTPEDGDYIGSNTEDEVDPGGYSSHDDSLSAMSLSDFSAGNLISNAKMYTSGTMTASQIQRFLDGKVSSCRDDYTCLKDFTQKTTTKSANAYCSGTYQGASRESAAQIIAKASRACGVSEKVLLVMLQKEQGLVTHVWPSEWRYDIAMGYACPDGAACDTRYFGFQNQVYMAAKQLQRYRKDSFFNWYPVGETSQVLWHPNESCGSGSVRIANDATAALYYYTPYQPNRAALNAGYGTGDACSSYGNRNFYNYYTDWFGSTGGGTGAKPESKDSLAVYRFWSEKFDNAHFYTVNRTEAQSLHSSDQNWTYEGTDFRVWPVSGKSCRAGTVAVHRFWSSKFASHFYTTNADEARTVRTTDENWDYEGIGFCTASGAQGDTTPVYRFWSAKFGKHFYTANASEARQLRRNDPNWAYEGVAMHAPASGPKPPALTG